MHYNMKLSVDANVRFTVRHEVSGCVYMYAHSSVCMLTYSVCMLRRSVCIAIAVAKVGRQETSGTQ